MPERRGPENAGGWALLAVAALVLLVLGLSIPEDDIVGWEVGAWAVFAIVCCLALFVPLFGAALQPDPRAGLAGRRARGAVGLFVFWLLDRRAPASR